MAHRKRAHAGRHLRRTKLGVIALLLGCVFACTTDVEVGRLVSTSPQGTGGQSPSDASTPDTATGGDGGLSSFTRDAGQGGTTSPSLQDAGVSGGVSGSTGGTAGNGEGSLLSACAPNVASAAQIARYEFDEGSGTRVSDAFGNDGTVTGSLMWTTRGRAGAAGGFGNDVVLVPANAKLSSIGTTGAITVAAWVYADPWPAGTQWIVHRAEAGTPYTSFGLGVSDAAPIFEVHFLSARASSMLPNGRWVHVAGTYDGITASLYVDGQPAGSLDIGWPLSDDTTELAIGAKMSANAKTGFFTGLIDEVVVFDQALPIADVKRLATCDGKLP
ncbi:MAG: LamG domain-containing protein [Deltaproteobacteria bacterium]|nr:LamG domain-containing protein [Deltaproteobacteria bacterium]